MNAKFRRLAGLSKLFRMLCTAAPFKTIIMVTFVLLVFFNKTATADNGVLKLTTGAEYTTGDFGGTQAIDEWYVPFTARYIVDNYVFRVTVPYILLTAPQGTILSSTTDGDVLLPGTGERTTETGLGDVIAGMTYRDLLATSDTALDLTAKVKFATADENKGLGTGKNDYTVQAEFYKFFDRFTPFGILGYKFRGDPPGINLNDSLLALAGGYYRLSPSFRAGADFYFQQASYSGLDDQKELSAFLGYKLSNTRYIRGYLIQGFGNASPDWGVGVLITFTQ